MCRLFLVSAILFAGLCSPSSQAQNGDGSAEECTFVNVDPEHPAVALLEQLGCQPEQLSIAHVARLRRHLAGLSF